VPRRGTCHNRVIVVVTIGAAVAAAKNRSSFARLDYQENFLLALKVTAKKMSHQSHERKMSGT